MTLTAWTQRIERAHPAALLALLLALQLAVHAKYFNTPPCGFHQWRQTHTLAVARNFYEEDMNLFAPRVDGRGNRSGVTGMEFPLLNYTIALGYQVFGFSQAVGHAVVLGFSFVALAMAFLYFKLLFRSQVLGVLGALGLLFSPLFVYYSFVAVPDIASLAFVFMLLFALRSWEQDQRWEQGVVMLAALLLAGLVKVSALLYFPLVALAFGTRKQWSLLAGSLGVLAVIAAWYLYARHLSALSGIFDFKLQPALVFDPVKLGRTTLKLFVQWLPELYVSYAQFAFLLTGVWVVLRSSTLDAGVKRHLGWMGLCLVVYIVGMYPQFEIHDYYMMLAMPLLIAGVTLGMQQWLVWGQSKGARAGIAGLLFLLVPVLGLARTLPRFEQRSWDLEQAVNLLDQVPLDRKALTIVASDESPCIDLYYFHRKGWSITERVEPQKFVGMIQDGAAVLLSDSRELEDRPEIRSHLYFLTDLGSFKLFKLQP